MKKLLSGVTGVLILMSILTGCSSAKKDVSATNQNINASSATDNKASSTSNSSTTSNNQSNSNTSNQSDAKKADGSSISGEVTAIDGSKITLKLIETPKQGDMGKAPNGNPPSQNGSAPAQNSNPPAQTGNTQAQNSNAPTQNGGSPSQNTASAQGSSANNENTNTAPQVKYTGETQTITVADGTSITTLNPSATADSDKEKTISIKDIKVGDKLNILYSGSDKTTISKINVMNGKSK